MGTLEIKTHWWDKDLSLVRHSIKFRHRRTGLPQFVNAITHLILLPIYFINLIMGLGWIMIILFKIVVFPQTRKGIQLVLQVLEDTKRVHPFLKFLPNYRLIAFIDRIKRSTRFQHFFDNRAKILYLRSFKNDNRKVYSSSFLTLELMLNTTLGTVGQFLAIDDFVEFTEEARSKFLRIRVNENSWQTEVRRLMDESRYLLIVPENTEGTLWELDTIITNLCYLKKSVFLNLVPAGVTPSFSGLDNVRYSEDDGELFLDILVRISGKNKDDFPPVDNICSAVVLGNELHLICVKENILSVKWVESTMAALFLLGNKSNPSIA